MNSKHLFIALCIAGLAGITMFSTSCKKVKASISDTEASAAADNVTADGTSQETQNLAEQAHTLGASGMRLSSANDMLSACAVITIDSSNTGSIPDTMTITFGSSPCLCHDGRYREGTMVVTYTGKYRNPGAVIDIHFNNYAVGPTATDLYSIGNTSTKHIVNNGYNSSGFMSWNVTSTMYITKPAGGTISYTDTKVRTQIAGNPTAHSWTNKFDISGTASGTAANGMAFTASTASGKDLIRDMSCPKHFTQGELDITPSGASTIAIDFGNGACDNSATITRNGVTRTITIT
jgi:hypothetical protein